MPEETMFQHLEKRDCKKHECARSNGRNKALKRTKQQEKQGKNPNKTTGETRETKRAEKQDETSTKAALVFLSSKKPGWIEIGGTYYCTLRGSRLKVYSIQIISFQASLKSITRQNCNDDVALDISFQNPVTILFYTILWGSSAYVLVILVPWIRFIRWKASLSLSFKHLAIDL
jgi:hypothetical protein